MSGEIDLTGSRGYLGLDVADFLTQHGHDVCDDMQIVNQRIDLSSTKLATLLPKSIRTIVHLAARVPHHGGIKNDDELLNQNRMIDENIVNAASEIGCRLVYISGCSLYSKRNLDILSETSVIEAGNPYFAAKIFVEKLVSEYDKSSILRVSGPFGAHVNPHTVLGIMLTRARRGEDIDIWGTGNREQDFVSNRDVGSAISLVIKHSATGTYNIAAGKPITMLELGTLISRKFNVKLRLGKTQDPRDYEQVRISIEKARAHLKWEPLHSLEQWIQELDS